MAYQIITVNLMDSRETLQELNEFLSTHTVLQVLTDTFCYGGVTYKSFTIEYVESLQEPMKNRLAGDRQAKTPKKDYKLLLPPRQFDLMMKCKSLREQISRKTGKSTFVIFRNDDLEFFVKELPNSLAQMKRLPKVSPSCVDSYGQPFLELLRREVPELKWGKEEQDWRPPNTETPESDDGKADKTEETVEEKPAGKEKDKQIVQGELKLD